MTAGAVESTEARRLHPTTLVQRVALAVPGLLLIALPYWRGGEAVPGFLLLIGALALLYGIFLMPLFVARYVRFRYWITPGEIVIQSGVFTRQRRSIPIERIQNIEIHQPVIARLFGTARVVISTAGSTTAEGVLEYVGLGEAHDIRRVVREYQRARAAHPVAPPVPIEAPHAPIDAPRGEQLPEPAATETGRTLITLPISRVLLSGVYRFSLLYILIIFSGIQYLNIEPDEIVDWFARGGLEAFTRVIAGSAWLAAIVAAVLAASFSWIAGIVVNLNRFYGFRLTREDDKLHRRHGLLTVTEGTIPLEKVQALVLRANALMRTHGWTALSLQTMGAATDQRGNQVAVPFARRREVFDITPDILPFDLPDRFERVSRLAIRRMTIRYSVMLLLATAIAWPFWSDAVWMLALWPVLPPLAYLQYRNHGYAFDGHRLFVRRGVFVHHVWVLPVEKFQVLFSSASLFQRRLGLASVQVDTAGSATFPVPEIVDLPQSGAVELVQRLHRAAQQRGGVGIATPLPF